MTFNIFSRSFSFVSIAIWTIAIWIFFAGTVFAQDIESKRPLEHEDYVKWNNVAAQSISNDGKWVSYLITNEESGNRLKIRELATTKEYSIKFASGARFSDDSKFIVYFINPDPKVIEKLRKEKAKKLPKQKLEILELATGVHQTIHDVQRFSLPRENSEWIAIKFFKPDDEETVKKGESSVKEEFEVTPEGLQRPVKEKKFAEEESEQQEQSKKGKEKTGKTSKETKAEESKEKKEGKGDKGSKKEKPTGSSLAIRSLVTSFEQRFDNVQNFSFSRKGERLVFSTSGEDKEDDGVSVFDTSKQSLKKIIDGRGNYNRIAMNLDGSQVAFLTDRDDYEADKPSWSVYHWKRGQSEAKKVAHEGTDGIPEGWWIASTGSPAFSEDNRRLYFNTMPKPEDAEAEKKEDEEKDPVAKLDIWHWQDPQLQPQQKLLAEIERNRSYRAVYDLRSKKIYQLAEKEIPTVLADTRSKSDFAVANSNVKYMKMLSWDIPGFQDIYLVNLKNGEKELVQDQVKYSGRMSPNGKFIYWFDSQNQHWFCMSTKDRKVVQVSKGIQFPLYNELHDTPSLPFPYGSAGWAEDDESFLVYDRYDIWKLDPNGNTQPVCMTLGEGRKNKIRYRLMQLDSEQRFVDLKKPQILSAFNDTTKASGYCRLKTGDDANIEDLIILDERISRLSKAKYSENVIFTRSTFEKSPDLWYSNLDFKKIGRISNANPQQSEYLWGDVELVNWKSKTGTDLNGLLYTPEGFDPNKKYPLMVYFYERNSDNLHTYYAPAAGRSIINFSFYVSRGYVIFVPDIPYRTGEPGESAADAVLPGVESIVKRGFIDEEKIGVQGHSWGGYQIAYLVTMTDVFACAESGAPVSNMTSAYGGIRWGSGMSRMFQYEKTQSRIGATLWEARDKYIANSPVFFADKINTPLLILHNDKDTAVPWYQGIELFVAMRRLSKPCWMLNYNDDPHWVMSDENRMDFAKRMQQFFDHYLKDEPMPSWMAKGIPAVDKGKEFGFEYVRPKGEVGETSESEPASEQP